MASPQSLGSLGRYELERVLGKGAMGIVYEALDPKLKRTVAIKTILLSQLDEETKKDFSQRFVREAHAVARLNHPNIVQVYDFGEQGGVAYLVMEFIQGNELKSALAANQVFDRNETVRIMCELLDALEFAHEAGVIHRDIKPANVMLDRQNRTKLTDFGVARLTDADRTNAERTQAGTMVGTPAYMSPEQIQGLRIDRRTDIFSAGIILYQFLTGQKPFTGDGAWTVAKKIIQDNPPTPSSLNLAVSPELDRVVAKALAKDPNQRFSNAREFAAALRRAADGKPGVEEDAAPTVVVQQRETHTPQALQSGEMELEFWRSIKDSTDANDFELYVRQFPQGIYASLAGRRIAKLRGLPGAEDSGTRTMQGTDRTRVHTSPRAETGTKARGAAEDRSVQPVDKTLKIAGAPAPAAVSAPSPVPSAAAKKSSLLVPAVLGVLVAAGVAAYFVLKPSPQPAVATAPGTSGAVAPAPPAAAGSPPAGAARVEADEKAKREAAEKTKSEAEEQARNEAAAQAKREADAKARRSAELQARREAELKAQAEAELRAKRDAEAKARRETESQAKREADARTQRDADAKAQREQAEAKAQRDADAKARLAAESSLWDSVKASRNTADVQKYLSRYPNGQYAEAARKRLAALEAARLEEQKRAEAEKLAAENARLNEQRVKEQQRARDAEAAKKKDAEKKKPAIIVPPTF